MKSVHSCFTRKSGLGEPAKYINNCIFFACVVSGVFLSGCASLFDSQKTLAAPITAAPPALAAVPIVLSAEAENTLNAAEQSVIESRIKRVLWRAATEQLAQARGAAKIFDSDNTLKHAKEVIALCALSNEQARSPAVAW